MERFKACEKEMKTKAFSKEGLLASSKMDPKVMQHGVAASGAPFGSVKGKVVGP